MLAQSMIINKILDTKDLSLVTLNNLTPEYFYNYKSEFLFLLNHKKTYGVVPDKATFISTFPDFDLFTVEEPDTYLLEQLYRDYNKSYLATCFNNVKHFLETDDVEKAQEWFDAAQKGQVAGKTLTCTDILSDTSRYDRYLERTSDKDKYYTSTGLPELDIAIGGIDRENENMVIYARPGVGKTQLLLYFLSAAAKSGLNVGLYEGEMTADKVGYRIDTFLGHIKNTSMNRGDLYIQKEYKQYIDSLPLQSLGSIKVLTPNDVPGGQVTVNVLRSFIEKENLDILFVDQYDLLDDASNARIKHEKIGNIARDIKLLQVEKHIPIISVCQQTREKNDDGSIDSAQVAGSDMISRYATILLALEQKYCETDKTVELDITVVKARDGGDHNKLKYATDFNIGIFNYIPNENDLLVSNTDYTKIANSYDPDYSESNDLDW